MLMRTILLLSACTLLAACSDDVDTPTFDRIQTATDPANGQTVEVILDEVIDPATDTADLDDGERYVAIVFSVKNTSDEPFTETDPSADAWLITDVSEDTIVPDLHEASDCEPFEEVPFGGANEPVPPGETISGCVTFEIPAEAGLVSFGYYFGEPLTFDLS